MQHQSLKGDDLNRLKAALSQNGTDGACLLIGGDTSFLGGAPEIPADCKVISAIASVPTHY